MTGQGGKWQSREGEWQSGGWEW